MSIPGALEKSPLKSSLSMPHPRHRSFLMFMGASVLNGESEPYPKYFTKGGSFWTNSISELTLPADTTADSPPSHVKTHPYESVAMIPLRFGNDIMGLLVFCDLRADLFSLETIALFERLASKLSIAIKERLDVEALQKSERNFRSLFENAPVGIFYDHFQWTRPCGQSGNGPYCRHGQYRRCTKAFYGFKPSALCIAKTAQAIF